MSGIGPVLQHFLQDGRVLQERIPHLETPHVEIEAPAHCLVHADDTTSNLWRKAGSVDKRISRRLTRQLSRPVVGGKYCEHTLHGVADVTSFAQRWETHLLLWLVLQCLEVQFQDGGFAIRIFNPLVETLAALLAKPATPDHLEYDLRHAEGLTPGITGRVLVQVIGYVDQCIQARQVSGAEDGRPGTPHTWAQDRVYLAHRVPFLQRTMQCGHRAVHADAIGNEVGGVFAQHNPFTEYLRGELLHKL